MAPRPAHPRNRFAVRGAVVLALGLGAAACSSGAVAPTPTDLGGGPGGGGVATTSLTTTTLQDLDDLVNATDRPPVPTAPAGYGAAADALGQVSALATMLIQRNGAYTGEPGPLVDAIGQELLSSFTGCDVAATVVSSTAGVGPAIGTIDLTFGCDPTTSGVEYVVTLEQPGSVDNPTESWTVTAATRSPRCTNGILDGLCV